MYEDMDTPIMSPSCGHSRNPSTSAFSVASSGVSTNIGSVGRRHQVGMPFDVPRKSVRAKLNDEGSSPYPMRPEQRPRPLVARQTPRLSAESPRHGAEARAPQSPCAADGPRCQSGRQAPRPTHARTASFGIERSKPTATPRVTHARTASAGTALSANGETQRPAVQTRPAATPRQTPRARAPQKVSAAGASGSSARSEGLTGRTASARSDFVPPARSTPAAAAARGATSAQSAPAAAVAPGSPRASPRAGFREQRPSPKPSPKLASRTLGSPKVCQSAPGPRPVRAPVAGGAQVGALARVSEEIDEGVVATQEALGAALCAMEDSVRSLYESSNCTGSSSSQFQSAHVPKDEGPSPSPRLERERSTQKSSSSTIPRMSSRESSRSSLEGDFSGEATRTSRVNSLGSGSKACPSRWLSAVLVMGQLADEEVSRALRTTSGSEQKRAEVQIAARAAEAP
eukprot:TRINITY_DN255_c0_g2_i2.p1 TRINITY_DN255_c0_g2~~TRINITY_DN255_c0_g2_i2.p1  ORF type:complete len:458 (+),score=49.92 TRINITY_DN255_c0_g2_i2:54-1427(+)